MALKTDILYVIEELFKDDDGTTHDETFGRTPDGVGMYWYGDEDEARGDVEQVRAVVYLDSMDDFELIRLADED